MGFNFSHPQKSGGAMAPLAPPSERALVLSDFSISRKNFDYYYPPINYFILTYPIALVVTRKISFPDWILV